jgi:hypothetical protein
LLTNHNQIRADIRTKHQLAFAPQTTKMLSAVGNAVHAVQKVSSLWNACLFPGSLPAAATFAGKNTQQLMFVMLSTGGC